MHGICGSFGVLCVGIFSSGVYGAGWNLTDTESTAGKGVTGILGGDFSLGLGQLGAQALALVVIWTVMFGIAFAFFKIQTMLTKGGIRSSVEDELAGLDVPEMGLQAYPIDASFSLDDIVIETLPKPQQEEIAAGKF